MRNFAELDDNNVVLRVLVVDESKDESWLNETFGGTWLETFEDGSEFGRYAGKGDSFDSDLQAYIPPKPFESWILDEKTFEWEPPISMPEDGESYVWDEPSNGWTKLED